MKRYFSNLKQAIEVAQNLDISSIVRELELQALDRNYTNELEFAIITHASAMDYYEKLAYSLQCFSEIPDEFKHMKYDLTVVISGISTNKLKGGIFKLKNFLKSYSSKIKVNGKSLEIKLLKSQKLLTCSEARKLAVDNSNDKCIQFIDLGDAIRMDNFWKDFTKFKLDGDHLFCSGPVYIDVNNLYHSDVIKKMAENNTSLHNATEDKQIIEDMVSQEFKKVHDNGENYFALETAGEMNITKRTKIKAGTRSDNSRYSSYNISGNRYSEYETNNRYSSYNYGPDSDEESTRYSSYYVHKLEYRESEFIHECKGDSQNEIFEYNGKTFIKGIARKLVTGYYDDESELRFNYEFALTGVLRQPTVLSSVMETDVLRCVYKFMSQNDLHVNMGEDLISHYLYRWIILELNFGNVWLVGIRPKNGDSHYNVLNNRVRSYKLKVNSNGYYLYTSHKDSMCRDLDEFGKDSDKYERELKSVILFLYALNKIDSKNKSHSYVKNCKVNKKLLIEKLLDLTGINIDMEYLTTKPEEVIR